MAFKRNFNKTSFAFLVLSAILAANAANVPRQAPAADPETLTAHELFDPNVLPPTGSFSYVEQTENDDENDSDQDGTPNHMPFGMVAVYGPDYKVSDVTARANWALTGCDPTSTDTQTVTAICTDLSDESSCGAVFNRGAEDTIVKMPGNCGPGPYARVVALEEDGEAEIPTAIKKRAVNGAKAYKMTFDYDLASIKAVEPDDTVVVRIDASNLPGYFNKLIQNTSPLHNKRAFTHDDNHELAERAFEKRYWSTSLSAWFTRVTTVEKSTQADILFTESFSNTLFDEKLSCGNGAANFTASAKMTASGSASLHVRYGFYFLGHILPSASVEQAYVYINTAASANVNLALDVKAKLNFESPKVPLITAIGLPGLSYPGIATIGPFFNIYGQITGKLTASGHFGIGASITSPAFEYSAGIGQSVTPVAVPTITITPNSNISVTNDVTLGGNIALHVIPEAALGISILNGFVLADAAISVDGYGFVSATASTSTSQVTVEAGVGVSLDASVEAGVGSSENFDFGSFNFYKHETVLFDKVFSLAAKRDGSEVEEEDVAPRKLDGRDLISGTFKCPK